MSKNVGFRQQTGSSNREREGGEKIVGTGKEGQEKWNAGS